MAALQRLRSALASARGRLAGERGTLTTYFVTAVPAAIMLTGLVVDGGGQIRAMQQANDISAEAARYAGQSINMGCATQGSKFVINPPSARLAAQRYVENTPADVELRSVSFEGHHTVRVQTTMQYDPVFLGLFGVPSKKIDGEGTAYQYRTDSQGEEYDPDVSWTGRCAGW